MQTFAMCMYPMRSLPLGIISQSFPFAFINRCTDTAPVNPRLTMTCVAFGRESLKLFIVEITRILFTRDPFHMGGWRLDLPAHIGPLTRNTTRAKNNGVEPRVFERFSKGTVKLLLGARSCDAHFDR